MSISECVEPCYLKTLNMVQLREIQKKLLLGRVIQHASPRQDADASGIIRIIAIMLSTIKHSATLKMRTPTDILLWPEGVLINKVPL